MQRRKWKGLHKTFGIILTVLTVLVAVFAQVSYSDDSKVIPNSQINSNIEAIRRGRWPAQLQGATGSSRPSQHGPHRNDPAEGVPKHAYSPFDEHRTREYPCPPGGCEIQKGHVLIKLSPQTQVLHLDSQGASILDATLNQAFSAYGVLSLKPIFPNALPPALGAQVISPQGKSLPKPDLTRWYRAVLADGNADVHSIVQTLSKTEGVEYAEPDYLRKPVGNFAGSMGGTSGIVQLLSLPGSSTDPLYDQQWHLPAAHIPEAWAYLESQGLPPGGSRDIVVAVIDTGVDYNHPDLAANMWVNSLEIPGNGIDDDGDGFVDDVHGANVVSGGNSGEPMDDHGHGTHVAGIIAAQGQNGSGGVGVAYNVQIMAIKSAQYSGVLAASDIAAGINYAVAHGADIINMSFGGYARSQVEEDALAVAFGQAVLVAAAGNDGKVNLPCPFGRDMYPAAYNWVLGVMARTSSPNAKGDYLSSFSNFDCTPQDSHEYELMAPGVGIWSALPNNQYAAWSGTSMATPIVSGIAALVRTKFPDKDIYSSRFIMGQIATTGPLLQAYTPLQGLPVSYRVPHAYAALTTFPKPKLSYLEHWLFDTTAQSATNDNDGIVDAAETIDLAVVIRNHWGKADPVTVKLEAWAQGAFQADPYVTMLIDTVDYGAVGSFSVDDNGLIYDSQGVITGVGNPFRFRVDPNTPNDHLIPFRLTMTGKNGLEPADTTTYTFTSYFNVIVQRGRELPKIISQDMTLTKDSLWLVPDMTLIRAGVTITVEPGTQIQFFSVDPKDPYSSQAKPMLQVEGTFLVQGTAAEPVEIFTGAFYLGYPIQILKTSTGRVELAYTRVMNPVIGGTYDLYTYAAVGYGPIDSIDHCYFSQDLVKGIYYYWVGQTKWDNQSGQAPIVGAPIVSNSTFRGLGCDLENQYNRPINVSDTISTNLFDSNFLRLTASIGNGNVFLKNYKLYKPQWGDREYWVSKGENVGPRLNTQNIRTAFPVTYNGKTYFAVSRDTGFDTAEIFAQQFGGHLVAVNDAEENAFLATYYNQYFNITTFNQTYPNDECWSVNSNSLVSCWDQFSNYYFVLGLTDRDQEGVFTWVSGEPLSYTNWRPNQPDNSGTCSTCNADYVLMYSEDGKWDDSDYGLYAPYVLEVPGVWTQEQIDAKRDEFIATMPFNTFTNNAFLNVWWDPDVTHWMQFFSLENRYTTHSINHNYWGTTSTTLINAAIVDFNDDFNKGPILYQPILTTAPETAFPFVADVALYNKGGQRISKVGAEPVTFEVAFNRDMDPTVQPAVSFGPDVPETDYTVHPVQGGWADARTWVGTFNITPITGDGYQFIRVAGARAASDPWLVTGDDSERFRFEIITSGTEAMNLQASGGEGYVDLMWTQNDFELLAGFNLHRSTTQNGSYTRINSSIIPPQQRTYRDTVVQPGQPYYYKFTVVKTDMSESDFSNIATATPLDTIPPMISHTPITEALPGLPLTISADVTDNVIVRTVKLYFRIIGTINYTNYAMTKTTGNRYSATIEGSLVASPGLEYYIEATDGVSMTRSGRAENPWQVKVVDKPVVTAVSPNRGPVSGGTSVTISGSNFRSGATVTFGGAAGSNVTVVSENQIMCTAPPYFPTVVDVTVTNPNKQSGTLLRSFIYEADVASMSLPNTGGGQNAIVEVPINASAVRGLAAIDLTITFDGSVLKGKSARTGTLTPGWSIAANTGTAGQIRVSMASAGGTVSGSGTLALLEFEVLGSPGANSVLHFANVSLNSGAIPVQTADGSFNVSLVYNVSGTVRSWNGGAGVSGVMLTLEGERIYTGLSGANGTYTVAGAPLGNFTLSPGKSDGVSGISAYDASLVLQHAAGLSTLSGHAATAADVDKSGVIDAMDAFYILQKAVDLISLPFPGAGVVWDFSPRTRSYTNLSSNQTGQDFTAILLGDASGNWSASGASNNMAAATNTPTVFVKEGTSAPDGTLEVSVWIDPDAAQVYSLELVLNYDSGRAVPVSANLGSVASGWLMSANLDRLGNIRLALAGALPVSSSGTMLALKFNVSGAQQGALFNQGQGQINEGQVPIQLIIETDEVVNIYVTRGSSCGGKTPCFTSIQDAIDAASTPAIINITQGTYDENIVLNSPKELTLRGGLDSTLTTVQSNTTINGSITIIDGKLSVENIVLK